MKKTVLALIAGLGIFATQGFCNSLSGGKITSIQATNSEVFQVYLQYTPQTNVTFVCPQSGWYTISRNDMVGASTTAYTTLFNFSMAAFTSGKEVNIFSTATTCPTTNPRFTSIQFR
jgi:hypothetical protein